MRRRNFDQALEYLKQAVARGSKNHLTHYYYAETLLRQTIGSVRPPVSNQIGEALRTSIKLMPGFAFAHFALANLAVMTDENLKEGLEAATTAARLEPQNKRFALALAELQMKTQDYEAAKKTLAALLSGDVDSKLRESATSIIESIERRTRAARTAQPKPEPKPDPAPAAGAESNKTREPAAKVSDPPPGQQAEYTPAKPAIYPTVKIEGAQMIHGVLVAIECAAGKWTLAVNANGKRIRFAVSNKAKLEFYSQDPRFEGAIRCGPVNKNAFIYFKPLAGQARFAGDAVAVEFTR